MYLEAMVSFLKMNKFILFLFILVSCKTNLCKESYQEINFYPDSENIFNLKLDKSISLNIGKNKLRFKDNSYMYFYESGNLLSAFLKEDQKVTIGSFKVIAEALGENTRDFCDISFYESGNIHKIWSIKNIKVLYNNEQFYVSSLNSENTLSPIQFSEEGLFLEGYLADNFEYKSYTFPKYSYISFLDDTLNKIILSENTLINGKCYLKGEIFTFQ